MAKDSTHGCQGPCGFLELGVLLPQVEPHRKKWHGIPTQCLYEDNARWCVEREGGDAPRRKQTSGTEHIDPGDGHDMGREEERSGEQGGE